MVADQQTGEFLIQKQATVVLPIASITKLMTGMVVLDAGMDLEESLTIEHGDMVGLRRRPVSDRMEQIKNALGAEAEIIAEFEGDRHRMPPEAVEERVIRIIQRRPETPDDLAKALGLHDLEIAKILEKLAKEGKVTYRVFNQRLYYEAAKKA
jgi:hypothetical protein